MTKEGIEQCHALKTRVNANIAGHVVSGTIKEIGYMSVRVGFGNVQRAICSITTDSGHDVYCHINDVDPAVN